MLLSSSFRNQHFDPFTIVFFDTRVLIFIRMLSHPSILPHRLRLSDSKTFHNLELNSPWLPYPMPHLRIYSFPEQFMQLENFTYQLVLYLES